MNETMKILAVSPFLLLRLLIAIALILCVLIGIVFLLTYFTLALLKTITNLVVGVKSEKKRNGPRHVLVTGGSSGIGLEVARIYLSLGDRVTIVARNVTKLKEAMEDLKKSYQRQIKFETVCQTLSLDVGSSEEQVKVGLKPAIDKFGEVDILINSAGTSIAAPFDELDSSEFERMYRVNVLGSVYPTRAILPSMKKRKEGKIVFVSSQVAQAAIHGYTAYAASKWALRGLAESLQMEVKPYNIHVSLAYPPDTDTPGYKEEMLTKPLITRKISETGSVFSAEFVARSIVSDIDKNYFTISTGLDGWFLKQLHPGMTPVNNILEATQQIVFSSPLRLLATCYLSFWDYLVFYYHRHPQEEEKASSNGKENQKKEN